MKFQYLETIESFALVGATGLVGEEFLSLLDEYKIKFPKLKLVASKESEGKKIQVHGKEYPVEVLDSDTFEGVEAAFFTVPNSITKKYTPIANANGTLVLDDSSVFRMDPAVALVVPEVNGHVLRDFSGLTIGVPNCTTTPLVLALKPLIDNYGVERVVVSTYQSVSGAGRRAHEELSQQTISLLQGKAASMEVFPHRIAFNCLPQIGSVLENGNTDEEEKIIRESRKILSAPELKISSTSVRVPTFFGHGLSVNVQLRDDFGKVEELRELLDKSPGLKVIDAPENVVYPTSVEAIGTNEVLVGRIRRDRSVKAGINFWLVSDNLRKGAALNALQTLELLLKYRRMS